MSVYTDEIIAPTTAAVTTGKFSTSYNATVFAGILLGTETVTLQQSRDGATWQDVILNGVVQKLTRKHTQITITGPGVYRVKKSVTVGTVGVSLFKTER